MDDKKTVSFEKVKNGYIVNLSIEKETSKGYDYKQEKYIASKPKEATELMNKLIGKVK